MGGDAEAGSGHVGSEALLGGPLDQLYRIMYSIATVPPPSAFPFCHPSSLDSTRTKSQGFSSTRSTRLCDSRVMPDAELHDKRRMVEVEDYKKLRHHVVAFRCSRRRLITQIHSQKRLLTVKLKRGKKQHSKEEKNMGKKERERERDKRGKGEIHTIIYSLKNRFTTVKIQTLGFTTFKAHGVLKNLG